MTDLTAFQPIPEQVISLTAESILRGVKVEWELELLGRDDTLLDDKYVEIYCSETNDIATATIIGKTKAANNYIDTSTAAGTTYNYWATSVNETGIQNPNTYPADLAGVSVIVDQVATIDIEDDAVSQMFIDVGVDFTASLWNIWEVLVTTPVILPTDLSKPVVFTVAGDFLTSSAGLPTNGFYSLKVILVLTDHNDVFVSENNQLLIWQTSGTYLPSGNWGDSYNYATADITTTLVELDVSALTGGFKAVLYTEQDRSGAGVVGETYFSSPSIMTQVLYK